MDAANKIGAVLTAADLAISVSASWKQRKPLHFSAEYQIIWVKVIMGGAFSSLGIQKTAWESLSGSPKNSEQKNKMSMWGEKK